MKFYFAPMEGITGYLYRNAYETYFGRIDRYMTPFLVPTQKKTFTHREREDVIPEHNEGMTVIPQVMTNRAEDLIWTAAKLQDLGYDRVNLNLGCPSQTVVSKGRGSGFLAFPDRLEEFFDQVFDDPLFGTGQMKLSVKTRIGKESPEEFPKLMEIYNRYPLEELIIHPRVQKDFYRNEPRMDAFAYGLEISKNPVCYNGNIFSTEDYRNLTERFPNLERVMMGRGLLTNPWLTAEILGETDRDREQLHGFHDLLFSGYLQVMSGEKNALYKMKELWCYLICLFEDGEFYGKKIRKAERKKDYDTAVDGIFRELQIRTGDIPFPFQKKQM